MSNNESNGVLTRLTADWLTNTPERGFELPFAQLLIADGHRIVHIDSHSPTEQGKDIISIDPQGVVCGFQLKQGNITNSYFRDELMGELRQLVELPCHHPSVAGQFCKPFLVTTGTLTEPAALALAQYNIGLESRKFARIELIDHHLLLSQFASPNLLAVINDPDCFARFMALYSSDGRDIADVELLYKLIDLLDTQILAEKNSKRTLATLSASLVILHLACHNTWRSANYYGECVVVAHAAMLVARTATRSGMEFSKIEPHLDLLYQELMLSLENLFEEADASPFLIGPHPRMETRDLWRIRVTLLVGSAALLCLLHRSHKKCRHDLEDRVIDFILKHRKEMIAWSENSAWAFYFVFALLRVRPRTTTDAERTLFTYLVSVSTRVSERNQRKSRFDPYMSLADVLLESTRSSNSLTQESQSSESYTLMPCIYLMRKSMLRQHLALVYPRLTKISYMEVSDIDPHDMFCHRSPSGMLKNRFLDRPTSWQKLGEELESHEDFSPKLPRILQRHSFLALTLIFCHPHRFSSNLVLWLDKTVLAQ